VGQLSQATQLLSKEPPPTAATVTGLAKDRPPFVDRLTRIAAPRTEASSASETTSQTLCIAS